MAGDDDYDGDDYDDDLDEELIDNFLRRAARNPDLCVICQEPHDGGDINGLPTCPRCRGRSSVPAPPAGAARIRRLLARAVARKAAAVEGSLVEFRRMYTDMSAEERDEFQATLKKTIETRGKRRDRDLLVASWRRRTNGDPEGPPSLVSARTLAAAIEAWERGEEFLAGKFDW